MLETVALKTLAVGDENSASEFATLAWFRCLCVRKNEGKIKIRLKCCAGDMRDTMSRQDTRVEWRSRSYIQTIPSDGIGSQNLTR